MNNQIEKTEEAAEEIMIEVGRKLAARTLGIDDENVDSFISERLSVLNESTKEELVDFICDALALDHLAECALQDDQEFDSEEVEGVTALIGDLGDSANAILETMR